MGNEEEVLRYYKGKLEIETDPEKLLLIFRKLKVVRVTSKHLQVTGILEPLRALRKHSGPVGLEAQKLVATWKSAPSSHHRSSTSHDKRHSSSRSSHNEGSVSNHGSSVNGAETERGHSHGGGGVGDGGPSLKRNAVPVRVKIEPCETEHSSAEVDNSFLPDSSASSPSDVEESDRRTDRSESRQSALGAVIKVEPVSPRDDHDHKRASSNGANDGRRGLSEKSGRNRPSVKSEKSSSRTDSSSNRKTSDSRRVESSSDKKADRVRPSGQPAVKREDGVDRSETRSERSADKQANRHAHHSSGRSDKKVERSRAGSGDGDRKSDHSHVSVSRSVKKEKVEKSRTRESLSSVKSERVLGSGDKSSRTDKHSKRSERDPIRSAEKRDKTVAMVTCSPRLTSPEREASASPVDPAPRRDRQSSAGAVPDAASSSSSSRKKDDRSSKKSKKAMKRAPEDGFNATMVSFEDCLGLNDVSSRPPLKKKKANMTPPPQSGTTSSKSSRRGAGHVTSKPKIKLEPLAIVKSEPSIRGGNSSSSTSPPVLNLPEILTKNVGEPPSHASIFSTLPEIQPNYKPMRHLPFDASPKKSREPQVDGDHFMSNRHKRTQVFSGRRTAPTVQSMFSLVECCVRILKECPYVMQRPFTTSTSWDLAPYNLIKPALEKCSPSLLESIEDLNDYLLEDSDELWQLHCTREFKGHEPDDMETWRELYSKLGMEREVKFKRITAIISQAQAKKAPERKAIMAFVDGAVKPPRGVARQQARFGTAGPMPIPREDRNKVSATAKANMSKHGKTGLAAANATSTSGLTVSVPAVYGEAGTSGSVRRVEGDSAQQKAGKKVAPLMQKTLKFMKNRFRR